jgi:hypothetical protein
MRRRSKTSFPQKGVTAMVLGFRSADVVLEGRLIENPEYRVSSAGDNATPVVVGAAESRRATARYRFEVERVVRLRER